MRVLVGAFRQHSDWVVVYVPDCGPWLQQNPYAYLLARIGEGLEAYKTACKKDKKAAHLPYELDFVLKPP